MAIKLSDQYPGRAEPPSIDYPLGAFKNRSAPQVLDGTPLDKEWANDKEGFFQALLSYRGVIPSGVPDTSLSSQYFNALAADPTEAVRGLPLVATQVEVDAGTNDGKAVTPKKLRAGFAISLLSNGYIAFPTWMGGLIIQWGSFTANGGTQNINFPLTFPTDVYHVSHGCFNDSYKFNIATLTPAMPTLAGFSVRLFEGANGSVPNLAAVNAVFAYFIAIGR